MPSKVTLAYLRTEIKNKIQYDELYSDTVIDQSINHAVDELALFCTYTKDVWQANSQIGQREILLPDELLLVYNATYDGIPLRYMTSDEYIQSGQDKTLSTGNPGKYYFRADDVGFYIGFDILPVSVKVVTVWHARKFDDMVLDTDEMPISRPFAQAVIHWAVQDLLQNDIVEDQQQITQRIDHHWNRYLFYRGQANALFSQNERRKVIRTRKR